MAVCQVYFIWHDCLLCVVFYLKITINYIIMELKLEVYEYLCELRTFEINNIKADYEDFGEKYDHDQENAEDYCCGNMQFDGKESSQEILSKYSITQTEYNEIVSQLEDKLSFGGCCWCS